MTPFALAAAALATYRLARLVAVEDGPALVLHRFRTWHRWPAWMLDLLSCPLCLSVWIAPAVVLLTITRPGLFVVCALAASGGATALYLQERGS
ncbi:MAG: DUF1360 domain-containing protein [Chloroflexi bacterium]|nr:DUF1360 domain-containing protein [Chloroflexota bacterium]